MMEEEEEEGTYMGISQLRKEPVNHGRGTNIQLKKHHGKDMPKMSVLGNPWMLHGRHRGISRVDSALILLGRDMNS